MFRLAGWCCLFAVGFASAQGVDAERLKKIDGIAEAAMKRGDVPGAVVVVLHKNEVVFRKAYGLRAKQPAEVPMTLDTAFDMASLTKPIATGTSIAVLIEEGKLRPSDKVSKHWPEFAANGKADVTVEHCLLHTSGLTADNAIADYKNGRAEAIKAIAGLKLEAPPGTRFRYSDVGFIVLGELVQRISGLPLDQFAEKRVFAPLKMTSTTYFPKDDLLKRTAPTGLRNGKIILGEVHDPRAFAMGGVAGHAGLFSTADDLVRYCRMLLNGGELDGQRVLGALSVKAFTEGKPVPPNGQRSLGWDVNTGFSSQRGGHTGFTGTSLWIDPPTQTAIIILSNRVHPNDKGNAAELRRQVATVVASAIPDAPRTNGSRIRNPRALAPVETGIDVLTREKFARLKGKNVALVTNHTGRDANGTSTIDLLHAAEGVKLVALFSPEHGIRGELDEKVGDGKDEKTGLPVYSLYGVRTKPTPELLKGVDTIVYDIQDAGCRFYTYISTLGHIMDAAKETKLRVVVLDRPNPIGGVAVEGPVRDPGRSSFVAFHEIPIRHGMTVGEMAKLFNEERQLGLELDVVAMTGWKRGDLYDRTGLTWRNPSPNMRHLTAALLYPGVGLLETTNISVGRGTERPFEWIGAPWIDGRKLAAELNQQGIPGLRFVPVSRTPVSSTFKDKLCGGVDFVVEDWNRVKPVSFGLGLAATIRKLYPNDWQTKNYDRLLVHKATFDAVVAGQPNAEIEKNWQPELTKFLARRAKVLLYPE
jgi:uncharacterized protein YbbC (DUF1343 family)/CubicO group peptidase (beta-lactamase class C family)